MLEKYNKRALSYLVILSGFYTFTILFCYQLNFGIIIITNVVITLICYLWILISIRRKYKVLAVSVRDVFVNLLTFYIITFNIVFIEFALSLVPLNSLTLALSISPIFVWTGIWLDYFREIRIKLNL